MVNAWIRRNPVIVSLAAIACGLLVWYLTRSFDERQDKAALAMARARLAACLVGEPVDRHGPDQARIRAIELAGAPDWPKRCARYANEVEQLLPHKEGAASGSAARLLEKGQLFEASHLSRQLEAVLKPEDDEPRPSWTDATRGVPLAPAPAPLATDIAPIAQGHYDPYDTGERDLVLLLGEETSCKFKAKDGGLEAIARCSFPADALGYGGRMQLASSDAGETFVVTYDGVRKFATGDTMVPLQNVRDLDRVDVSVVDGAIYVWPADPKLTTVARSNQVPLKVRASSASMLVRDQLIWREGKRVVAASVAGDKTSTPVEITQLADRPLPGGCFTHDIIALLLEVDEQSTRVAVYANGTWKVSEPGPRYWLRCEGNRVIGLHWTREGKTTLRIERIDCTPGGCTTSQGSTSGIGEQADVAAIGDDTIVVWADDLVRAVQGPLAQLTKEKSFPVFDGFDGDHMYNRHTDAGMLVHDVHVFGRGKSAIVVLDGQGARAIHVRDRHPERVEVTFE